MTTAHRGAPAGPAPARQHRSNHNRAWISVALIPVGFVLAFAAAQGIYALFGYLPEEGNAPWWVVLVSAVPAVALFLVPCVAAVVYGNRARSEGDRRGWAPLIIGAVLGLWMVLINVLPIFAA